MTETVAAIRRVLPRGSSFPSLVETRSGRLLVMKLGGAGQGMRGLAAEFVAGSIARLAGLSVPHTLPVVLPAGLPWEVGSDEFYEAVQRSVGWNLGVELIADAVDLAPADIVSLAPAFLDRLAGVDALLQNVDRTAANLNVMRDVQGQPWAIDFGACLLVDGVSRGKLEARLALPANHILAGREPSPISPQALAASLAGRDLAGIVAEMPETWAGELGLAPATLARRLTAYFQSIAPG